MKPDLDLQRKINQQLHTMRIDTNKDTVLCHKCGSEYFTAAIRLAKSKMDLRNEAIGMITEQQHVFCFHCRERLPSKMADVITKKDRDLANVNETTES